MADEFEDIEFGDSHSGLQTETTSVAAATPATPKNEDEFTQLLRRLELRSSAPATSISSFMALVTIIDPPFKPRTLHRPWSISAGAGKFGSVEVHRYVPGRNQDVFNKTSAIKLNAYQPDARRTGDYYAVKRLTSFNETEQSRPKPKPNPFSQFADELRILAHKDLHGHKNLIFLFGVSHSPSRSHGCLAEPSFVLQEGDCGDLHSFYRESTLSANQQTLSEIKMSLCFDIAVGLETLHRHGVVHCDLKPKNILIRRRNGRDTNVFSFKGRKAAAEVAVKALVGNSPFIAVLADFGGSLILSDTEADAMRPKVWTPFWSAPECYPRVAISKNLLPRIDIYAAGLIFAFILLEGRDIFTQVVERGIMHSHDITMDPVRVEALKVSNGVLNLAKKKVREFETVRFALYADGTRKCLFRDTMYAQPYVDIFEAILETCLHADPIRRVANATDMLNPWKEALRNNFHLQKGLAYQEPALFRSYRSGALGAVDYFEQTETCSRMNGHCSAVPAVFQDTNADLSSGVFDIRKAFTTYRAGLTSGLKTEILNDLFIEVEIVQSIQRLGPSSSRLADIVPPIQLRRAADCAYQIGLAYLEGFGISRSDKEALKWIRTAAEWGSHLGQANYLSMSSTLGLAHNSNTNPASTPEAISWTVNAVSERGNLVAATYLSGYSISISTSAIRKYRGGFEMQRWREFEEHTGLGQELFKSSNLSALDAYFAEADMAHIFAIGSGWTILHYAVLSGNPAAVIHLVEELKADIRCLSWHSETALDIAIATENSAVIDYLLTQHENAKPHFKVGSCPLQNIAFLPEEPIADIVYRVLSMSQPIDIDVRGEVTARTALMNTMLIEAPLYPGSMRTAVETLLAFGANPLLTTAEAGNASPLLLSVQKLDHDLVKLMLDAISTNEHRVPLTDPTRARPEPCNELARSFLKLLQTPRSVRLTRGVSNYKESYSEVVKLLVMENIASELPYACKASKHDPLGLACYYGDYEAAAAMLSISPEINRQFLGTLVGDAGLDALLVAVDCGFAETIDIILPCMMGHKDVTEYNVLISGVHYQPALVPKIYSHFEAAGKGSKLMSYVDPWGATALDIALEYELMDLAKFLIGKGATYDQYRLKGDHSIDDGKQSTLASVLPRMKPVQFLMGLNPQPSLVVTDSGLNVFHILALDENLIGTSVGRNEFLSVLDYFHALDPSLIHAHGGTASLTPFHIVSLQYAEVVGDFLHNHGADINALDSEGNTPLDILYFHTAGDRPQRQMLTVGTSGDELTTGITICDFALAGPIYWAKEITISKRIMDLYLTWGAKRSKDL